ncbi:MAG: GTP-sensing pleiotropic transcriptional regulator CodY [Bacillota bacterium]
MSSLLERTRRVNRLIQNAAGYSVDFRELAEVLADTMWCQAFVIARNGRLLGHSLTIVSEADDEQPETLETGFVPREANEELLRVPETSANLVPSGGLRIFQDELLGGSEACRVTVVPVHGGGDRVATLVLLRADSSLDEDDLVIAEYGAAVVGMEILRSRSEKMEEEARKRTSVQMALDTLSYSEQEAVEHIFDELSGDEGLLVASKIADRVGITRSVIVNALRKFESAGVIESRSLGMKGTYIRVLNDRLFDELDKLRAR